MFSFIGLKGFYKIYDYGYYFEDEISVGDRIKIDVVNKQNGKVKDTYSTIIFEIEKTEIIKIKDKKEREKYLENISDEIHQELIFGWKNKYYKKEFKTEEKLDCDNYFFVVRLDTTNYEITSNNSDDDFVDWL